MHTLISNLKHKCPKIGLEISIWEVHQLSGRLPTEMAVGVHGITYRTN